MTTTLAAPAARTATPTARTSFASMTKAEWISLTSLRGNTIALIIGAVLVIGSVMLTTAVSRAALPRDAGDLAQRVNLELAAAHMKELHAQVRG
ncbi:hypothetical protein SB769_34210, partial [Burkholderia sp. SIMBA_024]